MLTAPSGVLVPNVNKDRRPDQHRRSGRLNRRPSTANVKTQRLSEEAEAECLRLFFLMLFEQPSYSSYHFQPTSTSFYLKLHSMQRGISANCEIQIVGARRKSCCLQVEDITVPGKPKVIIGVRIACVFNRPINT